MSLPILYSYRRCPYAMRARMALKYAGIEVNIIEISLRNKPAQMLQASPKGTVPVLVLADGSVIDESLQIMRMALASNDAEGWLAGDASDAVDLIAENDGVFKQALDHYKYAERWTEKSKTEHRAEGEVFLVKLEKRLNQASFLSGHKIGLSDMAIFPFIRQFAGIDATWFETAPYPKLRAWLKARVESSLFLGVMHKVKY